MDLKKKPFEVPTQTTYGALNELTQAHSDKIKTRGHAWAWGHYKMTMPTRTTISTQFQRP